MKIHALTVCVDYSDLLARSIDRWKASLASLIVVTSMGDGATAQLALKAGVTVVATDAFYEDGAMFNKGRALERARRLLPFVDWHLFVDADVVPPEDWLSIVTAAAPPPGMIYGARRLREDGAAIHEAEGMAGFFFLFHSSDAHATAPLAQDFIHAGNYDSDFLRRWPRSQQRVLPLDLVHLGEPGVNWCGKGNEAAMRRIREQRRTRSWRLEVVKR